MEAPPRVASTADDAEATPALEQKPAPPPPSPTPGMPAEPTMNSTQILCVLRLAANVNKIHWYSESLAKDQRFGTRHRTCAVVSSSGALLKEKFGRVIDAFDMVVRFNTAPTEGFEDFVGVRDDFRFINNQIAGKILYNHSLKGDTFLKNGEQLHLTNSTTYVAFVDNAKQADEQQKLKDKFPWMDFYWGNIGMQVALTKALRLIYTDSAWFGLTTEAYDWMATTGGVGMLLALDMCDQVKAFGMADSTGADKWPYHYWDDHTAAMGFSGSTNKFARTFNVEKDLWRRLAQEGPEGVDATETATIPGFSQVNCPEGDKYLDEQIEGSPSDLPVCTAELQARSVMCMGYNAESSWIGIVFSVLLTLLLPLAIFGACSKSRDNNADFSMGDSTSSGAQGSGDVVLAGVFDIGISNVGRTTSQQYEAAGHVVRSGALVLHGALLVSADLLVSSSATKVRFAGDVSDYPWDPVLLALLIEVSKGAGALALLLAVDVPREESLLGLWEREPSSLELAHDVGNFDSAESSDDETSTTMGVWIEAALRLAPVSGLCAVNDWLVLHALTQVTLDTCIVWRSSVVLFAAQTRLCCSRVTPRRRHLVALLSSSVACCLHSFAAGGAWSPPGPEVLLVLASAALAAASAGMTDRL
eukprot:TRINITY_DN27123_c0_g1_i1.p1 TRINITY_DN27123_c0_g1~~TRINITY_DN27123_c0_g1_i1.p1  ORF type:complete len:753 (-),score=145.03 TRINITY_DN27123_c0_g1_i1:581-2512(-)